MISRFQKFHNPPPRHGMRTLCPTSKFISTSLVTWFRIWARSLSHQVGLSAHDWMSAIKQITTNYFYLTSAFITIIGLSWILSTLLPASNDNTMMKDTPWKVPESSFTIHFCECLETLKSMITPYFTWDKFTKLQDTLKSPMQGHF